MRTKHLIRRSARQPKQLTEIGRNLILGQLRPSIGRVEGSAKRGR